MNAIEWKSLTDEEIQKANHLLKDDVERLSLLSFSSIKYKFNATIKVVFWFIYVRT